MKIFREPHVELESAAALIKLGCGSALYFWTGNRSHSYPLVYHLVA